VTPRSHSRLSVSSPLRGEGPIDPFDSKRTRGPPRQPAELFVVRRLPRGGRVLDTPTRLLSSRLARIERPAERDPGDGSRG
jgi:hypothetical protein